MNELQDAITLAEDYFPRDISGVDLATAVTITEVELAYVRKHGTVTQELQTLARLADLKLQMAGEGK